MGSVAFLSPRILVQACDSPRKGQPENSVDIRQIRGQADQAELVHQIQPMLSGSPGKVVVDGIVVQAHAIAEFIDQIRPKGVGVGYSGGPVVALLPALPDGRECSCGAAVFPGAAVPADPAVAPVKLILVRKLVVNPGGPISGRIPRPDFEFPVVLAMNRGQIPIVWAREELVLDFFRNEIDHVRGNHVVEEWLAGEGIGQDNGWKKIGKIPIPVILRCHSGCHVLSCGTAS